MAFLDGAQSCTSFQTQGFKNKKKKKLGCADWTVASLILNLHLEMWAFWILPLGQV